MTRKQPRALDIFFLNSILTLIPLVLLPFLVSHQWKIAAPSDFSWVVAFLLLTVIGEQIGSIWTPPAWLLDGLLAIPILFLFLHQSLLVALLLLMQLIIKVALSPQTLQQLDLRIGDLLEQGIIPIFLAIALLATVIDRIRGPQIILIAALFLTKVAFTLPLHGFLDFLWPFLALVLNIMLYTQQLLSLPALIVTLIILIASLAFYPQRKNSEQFPPLLLLALTLTTTLL